MEASDWHLPGLLISMYPYINMFNYAFELEGTKSPLLNYAKLQFYRNLESVVFIEKREENPIHVRNALIRKKMVALE